MVCVGCECRTGLELVQERWGEERRQRGAGARGGGCDQSRWLLIERRKKGKEQEQERKGKSDCLSLSSPSLFRHSHLLEHDALGVRRPGERLLPLGAEVGLFVVFVGPQLRAAVRLELAPGSETARLAAMRAMVFF